MVFDVNLGENNDDMSWQIDIHTAAAVQCTMVGYVLLDSTLKSLIEEHARLDFSDFLSM